MIRPVNKATPVRAATAATALSVLCRATRFRARYQGVAGRTDVLQSAGSLLRRQVARGAAGDAGHGQATVLADPLGQATVGHARLLVLVDEDAQWGGHAGMSTTLRVE
jgi:hypothetical protein